MAPYEPPNTHYSQLDVSKYDKHVILSLIGKGGKGFYGLTNKLNLEYLWYDQDRKVIEIWGSFGALKAGAQQKLSNIINDFSQKFQ